MSSLTQLTRLRAYGNKLSWLPTEFRSQCNLKILRLGGNKFGTETQDGLGVIRNMRAFEKLYLRDNPNLTEIPDYVANKRNLRIRGVDMDEIEIRETASFPNAFEFTRVLSGGSAGLLFNVAVCMIVASVLS